MLIRTLVREWISGRLTHLGRRVSLCALAALLAGFGLSAQTTADELPSLEALLKGQKKQPGSVPARVQQETQFDVIDPQWEKPAVVEPAAAEVTETAKLEPVPASAADLIESIESAGDSATRVTHAIPRRDLPAPRELRPAPPATSRGPVIVQRQLASASSAPATTTAAEEPIAHPPRKFVLGSVEVEKLIARARHELETGDVAMAHAFAEAAAETDIPRTLFDENAKLLIAEVELVRHLQLQQTAARQSGEIETPDAETEPATLAQSIEQQPRVWRALGGGTLITTPPSVDADGSRQELPEPRGLRMLSQVPHLHQTMGSSRGWEPISYSWEAPALKYNPLYFEDPQLERHGNEIAYVQPAISAGRFFATIPTLPYQMGTEGNSVCHTVYDLGNDRPGTCQPYSIPLLPLSLTGALTQGGAATALVFILP